jgi:hypothetical protein
MAREREQQRRAGNRDPGRRQPAEAAANCADRPKQR